MMGQQQMRQSMAGMRTRLRSGMSGMGQSMAGMRTRWRSGMSGMGNRVRGLIPKGKGTCDGRSLLTKVFFALFVLATVSHFVANLVILLLDRTKSRVWGAVVNIFFFFVEIRYIWYFIGYKECAFGKALFFWLLTGIVRVAMLTLFGLNKGLMEELESSSIGHSIFPTRRPPRRPHRRPHRRLRCRERKQHASNDTRRRRQLSCYRLPLALVATLYHAASCASIGLKTTS